MSTRSWARLARQAFHARRRRAGAPARRRQALSLRHRVRLLRQALARFGAQPEPAGRADVGRRGRGLPQSARYAEAVRLRRYDEGAKDPRASTADFDHFLRHVEAAGCLIVIGRSDVEAAWARIKPHVRRTPVIELPAGSLGWHARRAEARISCRSAAPSRAAARIHKLLASTRCRRRALSPPRAATTAPPRLCRARARPQGRDLRADHRRPDQGGAAQELRRRRAPDRRRLCRGARRRPRSAPPKPAR